MNTNTATAEAPTTAPAEAVEDRKPSQEVAAPVAAPPASQSEAGKMRARDIRIGKNGINFTNASEVMAFSHMMADSGAAVPAHCRGLPGVCLGIIDDAIRFGMSPYALARESYMVNGNIAYMAKAVAGIIIARAPIKGRPKIAYDGEGAKRVCTVTFVTLDGEVIEHSSPPFSQIQPKNSPLWTTNPDQQLGYYTLRSGGRLIFPDVLMGLYDVDEMGVDNPLPVAPPEQPASVLTRLPAPTGDEQRNGDTAHETVNGGMDEAASRNVAKQNEDGLTDDERKLITDLAADLEPCKTQKEIDVVAGEYADMIEHQAEGVRKTALALIVERRETMPKAKPKKPPAEKTLV